MPSTILGPGCLLYKCRRCGELTRPFLRASLGKSMSNLCTKGVDMQGHAHPARLLDMHRCEDGHLGFMDPVGGEFGAKDGTDGPAA